MPKGKKPKRVAPNKKDHGKSLSAASPSITCCMIAKNEQNLLAQCLGSIAGLVSEIILVDTGSEDNTISIADSFGAKIFHLPWMNDFAAARNFSLEQATGDWILVLDADEAIAETDHAQLQKLIKDRHSCYNFVQRHYTNEFELSSFKPACGEYGKWEKNYLGYLESSLVRLFPNRHGIKYRGRVHELVEHSICEMRKHQILPSNVPIHHYGHADQMRVKRNKGSLYSQLGEDKLQDGYRGWKEYFEIAVEYNHAKRFEEAVTAFKESIKLNAHRATSWSNLAYALLEQQQMIEATTALHTALQIDPYSAEALSNMGVLMLRLGELEKGEYFLRQAIKFNPRLVVAHCNLGRTLMQAYRFRDAANAYRQALDLVPACEEILLQLAAAYLSAKDFAQAQTVVLEGLKADPESGALQAGLRSIRQIAGAAAEAK